MIQANKQSALEIAGNDPLSLALVSTPAFQRLAQIHFLGAIDYRLVPHPNGQYGARRYSRHEHSLGVLQLAQLYAEEAGLTPRDRDLVCAAAILHDIGHPPLSHSMEATFKKRLGIDHHRATQDIVCGRVPLGEAVYSTLRGYNVNVEEVTALVSGKDDRFHGFFSGPITFDTIEGVLRSWSYVGNPSSTPTPDAVALAAMRRSNTTDRDTVDAFWRRKGDVYHYVIHSSTGVLSDHACSMFLERNLTQIKAEHYFGTETSLFSQLPGLLRLLRSDTFEADASQLLGGSIPFDKRHYYVDHSADFFAREDVKRYRQRRDPSHLSADRLQGRATDHATQQPVNQRLF